MSFVSGKIGRDSVIQKAVAEDITSNNLFTGSITHVFAQLIQSADGAIQNDIDRNTDANGVLTLSAAESLNMQKLVGDQSIAAQTGTSTLKSVKDSIEAAVRNIA